MKWSRKIIPQLKRFKLFRRTRTVTIDTDSSLFKSLFDSLIQIDSSYWFRLKKKNPNRKRMHVLKKCTKYEFKRWLNEFSLYLVSSQNDLMIWYTVTYFYWFNKILNILISKQETSSFFNPNNQNYSPNTSCGGKTSVRLTWSRSSDVRVRRLEVEGAVIGSRCSAVRRQGGNVSG